MTSITCQLNNEPSQDCSSGSIVFPSLADGDHQATISTVTSTGAITQMKRVFRKDTTGPVLTVTNNISAVTAKTSASFKFFATDALSRVRGYKCALDGKAFSRCSSPLNRSGLVSGKSYSVSIRASDRAGNLSKIYSFSWTVKGGVPTAVLSSNLPSPMTSSTQITLTFTGTNAASFKCSLDGAVSTVCTSPQTLTVSANKLHQFSVTPISATSVLGAASSYSWTVDTLPPTSPTLLANIPTSTTSKSATFNFSSTDNLSGVTHYTCSLNNAAPITCTTPYNLTVNNDGAYTLAVRAVDSAGNTSAPGSFSWTVSATMPPPADGKTLFASNCASCHNGPDTFDSTKTTKTNRTSAQISASINSLAPMNTIAGLKTLTTVQIDAIAAYLKTTPPPPALACSTPFAPERTPLRLLSNLEYDSIAADIFLSKRKPSLDTKFDVPALGSSGFSNTSMTSETSSPPISDLTVEKYWTAAGALANEVIANKSQSGSAYSALASCAVGVSSVTDTCYNSILRNVTLKVWRRPVSETSTNNEFSRLMPILKSGGSFDVGFRDFLKALLISPNFLVVSFTPGTTVSTTSQVFTLNNYQLASRLSFFLWQSAPDDTLLGLAANGTLSNTTTLQSQVLRMLKDPKGKRFASVMTNEWIGANQILGLGLTTVDTATLNSMVAETQFMFEDIVNTDSSFLNSISANYSFLNKVLADYYKVPFNGAVSTQFYKTSLDSTPRRGVLNQAAFLIATSGAPNQTHPVSRGKIIARKIACYDIAPPPANLDTSLPANIPANSTPAEILAIHTQRAQCAGCHNSIDPHGLPLETFDSRGIWRTNYLDIGGRSIDQSGKLPSGETFSSTQEFMSTLINSSNVRSCLVRNVMAAGLARKVASLNDQCNATQISELSMNTNSKLSDLISNIVISRQFRMQTTETP